MTVKVIRQLLEDGQAGIADEGVRREIASLADLLTAIDDRSVADLCKAIAPAIAKLSKPAKAPAKKAKPATRSLDACLDELTALRDDNAAFEAVIARLEKDRTFKVADAKDLAARFTGQPATYKTKKDALKAILQRQIVDKRTADRAPQISGLF